MLWRSSQTGQFYQIVVADSATGNNISFNNLNVDTLATDGII
ncbi:hypothetical protein [Abyssogena phaseoliformis symbiont]|nr:hypothetical protein [Abyssogena phaseoliformis symbiont]MBW5288779.1 hypothetical protein [Candidatus Ruthia sp. Apha_13_S6]